MPPRSASWLTAPLVITAPRSGLARRGCGDRHRTLSVGVIQRAAAWAIVHFKEPQLTAALIAVLAVGWLAVALGVARGLTAALTVAARGLTRLGAFNPPGRWRAAGVLVAASSLPRSRSRGGSPRRAAR